MKIVTYNCFAQFDGHLINRTTKIAEILAMKNYDVICLQEVALDCQKQILNEKLEKYYNIYNSNHYNRKYDVYCYLYFLLLLLIFYRLSQRVTNIYLKCFILSIPFIFFPQIFDKVCCYIINFKLANDYKISHKK